MGSIFFDVTKEKAWGNRSCRKLCKMILGCFIAFYGFGMRTFAQVAGCTDPLANNFNAAATINNGSCTYNITNYFPPVKIDLLNTGLAENSGLQMAGNYLWTFNDGGGAAAIYRIDTTTNTILQKVNLSGAINIDWEDIAFDGGYFYVGDFGNNANGARSDLKIYKFPFSSIPDYASNPEITIPASEIAIIQFSYSDQPIPAPTTTNNTKYDCEAMLVYGNKIHLFTKNWIDLNTTHYEITGLDAGIYIAVPVETLATNYLVTAADKVYGQNIVALLGYQNSGFGLHFMHLLTGFSGGNFFNGNKRKINLPNAFEMGQAEGLTFRTGSYGYISNEKLAPLSVNQKLRSFSVMDFLSNIAPTYIFTGNGKWDNPANWYNNLVPPAMIVSGSEIIIDPVSGGSCELNIPYTVPNGVKITINANKRFIIDAMLTVQ